MCAYCVQCILTLHEGQLTIAWIKEIAEFDRGVSYDCMPRLTSRFQGSAHVRSREII